MEYPEDERTFEIQDQYLIGSSFLVKPVTKDKVESIEIYFPGNKEKWYDYETFEVFESFDVTQKLAKIPTPLDKLPVFVKSGSIIPKKEETALTTLRMKENPFHLLIILDSEVKFILFYFILFYLLRHFFFFLIIAICIW